MTDGKIGVSLSRASNDEAGDGDFCVEMVVYNQHILRALIVRKLVHGKRASITRLINNMGYGFNNTVSKALEIRNLVGLKTIPTDSDGNWKPIVIELAAFLKVKPDILFPGLLKTELPLQHSKRVRVNIGESIQWVVM